MDLWVSEVSNCASDQVVKILAGNKSDLNAVVDSATARHKAEQLGLSYVEVSAKSGFHLDLLFATLVKSILDSGKVPPLPEKPPQPFAEKTQTASDKPLSLKLLTSFMSMRISDFFQ